MCGIFGYLNYNHTRSRNEIINTLINGLKRLEYRGYDSAGMAFDADAPISEKNPQIKLFMAIILE
ncbi:hypothetical protein HZS_7086 [Henneguya salminicola]|nr:hypothetical protein HZS_7086 [Henneguya salminicola]